jgi:hypothetical protein
MSIRGLFLESEYSPLQLLVGFSGKRAIDNIRQGEGILGFPRLLNEAKHVPY